MGPIILARMNKPELPPLPPAPAGIYLHYKGDRYVVSGPARHSETHDVVVVYRPLQGDGSWWVRPYDMFFEEVVVDGVARPRFQRIPGS
jgi:hypothetical protein